LKTTTFHIILLILVGSYNLNAQPKDAGKEKSILSDSDFIFLKELTREAVDSSRIFPGQMMNRSTCFL